MSSSVFRGGNGGSDFEHPAQGHTADAMGNPGSELCPLGSDFVFGSLHWPQYNEGIRFSGRFQQERLV